jgi:hypothetical protein
MPHEGDRRITRPVWEHWKYRSAPNPANRRAGVSGAKKARMPHEGDRRITRPVWEHGKYRSAPNPAHRRAGVSGAKKARMLMKVTAGLPAWFGSVGVPQRPQSGG